MIEEQHNTPIHSSDKCLEIIKDGSISPAFFKANRFLINSHKENLKNLPDTEKMEFIENLWAECFHANLTTLPNSSYYTHLEFFCEQDLMIFWMKWHS